MSNGGYGKIAHTIDGASIASEASRATLYREHKAGRLRIIKVGRRSYIMDDDLRAWLAGMPTLNGAGSESAR